MDDLRYPLGPFDPLAPVTADQVRRAVDDIRALPGRLEEAVEGLDDAQLDTGYRPGGWTVRQVVHHLADSHVNAHVRLRLALTEERPPVRGYAEALWAELPDARTLPLDPSLAILRGLHARWAALLDALEPHQLERTFHHSELGDMNLARHTCLYGWHARHHVAHITELRSREGW